MAALIDLDDVSSDADSVEFNCCGVEQELAAQT